MDRLRKMERWYEEEREKPKKTKLFQKIRRDSKFHQEQAHLVFLFIFVSFLIQEQREETRKREQQEEKAEKKKAKPS